jgi:hypothetical protein
MHHNEHDPRRFHDLRHRRDMHRYHPHHEDDFNDFQSRWGEPVPYIHLNHQGDSHPENRRMERDQDERHYYGKEDWLPDREHMQRHPHHPEQRHHHQEPTWRQRDVNFSPNNQRVEDRWYEDPLMPHPHSNRRASDSWYDDWHERNR